ncbi:MAG: putative transporter [Myxococcota bacterium]|jgi:putative transport protein|nr:putative transporter [Myxococcota bacterium]MBP8971982.1 putative transporter [Myxococcota bacterium]HHW97083.1 putative transporter [Oligoflexales bacterium]
MDWVVSLFTEQSVANSILILALVVASGLALGSIKFKGISLSVGGVLFAGLAFGHFGFCLNPDLLDFLRELGLILFVYSIGLQVGPGFVSSLRKQGLKLNLFAIAVVVLGSATALVISYIAKIDNPATIGMLSGAVTNTPSLGAAQQALATLGRSREAIQTVGMAYAVSYPFGIVGIILTLVLIKRVFKVDIAKEAAEFETLRHGPTEALNGIDILITNENLHGKAVKDVLAITTSKVVLSRLSRDGKQVVPTANTILQVGDIVHAVAKKEALDAFQTLVGQRSDVSITASPSEIVIASVVVTKPEHVGKTLVELALPANHGVVITRVTRSGIEFAPTRNMRMQLGDRLVIVGSQEGIKTASEALGNEVGQLDRPHTLSVFLGVSLGVLVASIPFTVPGLPAPVRLGFAAGPLLVAIVLGRIGRIGPFVTYLPNGAKKLLAELGISMFLGCVGLKSGERFVQLLTSGDGLKWMALAMLITLLPILIVGFTARIWKKMNYVSLCGLLAGSMTDPPALAYATQMIGNDSPSISYATVYPTTMILRVLFAQIVVLFLA